MIGRRGGCGPGDIQVFVAAGMDPRYSRGGESKEEGADGIELKLCLRLSAALAK